MYYDTDGAFITGAVIVSIWIVVEHNLAKIVTAVASNYISTTNGQVLCKRKMAKVYFGLKYIAHF